MSGPMERSDLERDNARLDEIDVREGRSTRVGGLDVARVLPTKGRRTVGAWCFVDLMAPSDWDDPQPLEVGPHPHVGLSTVTWLFHGEVLHGDSLGTEQLIKPGELNLMTAGRGIAHSELGVSQGVRGVQMWIAQPDATRHGSSRFEHHAELPVTEIGGAEAKVLVGSLGGAQSSVQVDTRLVGVELSVAAGTVEVPLEPTFEHAVVPIDRPVKVGEAITEPGWLALVPDGIGSVPLVADGPGTVILIGGEPLGERVQMWWNFVARTKDEITDAWRAWQEDDTDRFGPVPSKLERIDAPPPPWIRSAR